MSLRRLEGEGEGRGREREGETLSLPHIFVSSSVSVSQNEFSIGPEDACMLPTGQWRGEQMPQRHHGNSRCYGAIQALLGFLIMPAAARIQLPESVSFPLGASGRRRRFFLLLKWIDRGNFMSSFLARDGVEMPDVLLKLFLPSCMVCVAVYSIPYLVGQEILYGQIKQMQ